MWPSAACRTAPPPALVLPERLQLFRWRAALLQQSRPSRQRWRYVSRAAGAEFADGGAATGLPPLPVLEEALQASAELQELCRLQLNLLTAALQLSLQAVLSSSIAGSVGGSLDEEALRQQLLLESGCLHASVYCRAPGSLQAGTLRLQLVATSDAVGCAADQQQQQQQQQQPAQRFLFLDGQEGGGGSQEDQEAWILSQPVIVLPDSGGLVLPLAHNGFLVGLLVVERCLEGCSPLQPAAAAESNGAAADGAAWAAAAGGGGGGSSSSSSNGGAAMPQAPTCLLFRSAELQLLKQTAAILSLACAMDMRAALERVGAAVRQRQASALVQAAKKPLSVMRTLGTMLLPRLQPGEPDRDFAQGILEQGSRLQDVVSQLQAALHPAAAAVAVPPPLQAGAGAGAGEGGLLGGGGGQRQLAQPAAPARPALPSSSIGSDYQWGASAGGGGGATIDLSIDEHTAAATLSVHQQPLQPASSSSSALSRTSGVAGSGTLSRGGSRASADLVDVLMPLLASASNLAGVNGVSFVLVEGSTSSAPAAAVAGTAAVAAAHQQPVALPAAEVAVGPGTLKRMLSQLIDGVLACAARGDLVQASLLPQAWQGRPGVAVSLCCCYGLAHGGGGPTATAGHLPRPPLQPEFAFLRSKAASAGGWFEVYADATPDVAHLGSATVAATLWLPTITRDSGWGSSL